MDLGIKGHTAVVTGGASGIGYACARQLAREGCKVMLWDISERVRDAANRISNETGTKCFARVVNVADLSAVETAAAETEDVAGALDHIVHAAAIGSGKFGFPFTNLSPSDWPRVLEINVMGMVYVAHAVAVRMVARGSGSMVFIASVAGQIGSPTDPPYSASKAANINFAQCMAKDLAPHNVRVNIVNPGMVRTPLNESVWRAWHDQEPAERRRSYDQWAADKIKSVTPLQRWQEPDDVADMVVFLSSERARQITGQTINVDGGQVMHW